MIDTFVNISRNNLGEVFVQTNMMTSKSEKLHYVSDCQIEMSKEDCIELAITLSYIHTYTEYENEDCYVQRFCDGKVIKKYQNE